MEWGILSVKLRQLDERVAQLHQRIRMSQTADLRRLRQERDTLAREFAQEARSLGDNLRQSKSALACELAPGYSEIERIIGQSMDRLHTPDRDNQDGEAAAEEKILLAEYALDFAHQAADRALLLALDAIVAQSTGQEGESISP